MRLAAAYLRVTQKPTFSTAEKARAAMQRPKWNPSPPQALQERHQVTRQTIGGFDSWSVTPKVASGEAVLYLHGGAYVATISPQHWDLVSRLADAGVRVEVPDYPLAPQHTYRDAYPFLRELWKHLLADADPARVSLAGDSAGAGLALGFAQDLAADNDPMPHRMVLIAPWLDLTLTGDGVAHAARRDPWLTIVGLQEAGLAWAGGDDPSLPKLSPINGPLTNLPPTDIYIGGRDLFLPDVRRLRTLAADAGWSLDVTECPGAVHVYPLVPVPEGRTARDRIVATLSS